MTNYIVLVCIHLVHKCLEWHSVLKIAVQRLSCDKHVAECRNRVCIEGVKGNLLDDIFVLFDFFDRDFTDVLAFS